MPECDLATAWLSEHDPRYGDRSHPYPYLTDKQQRTRRREIPCGLIDTTPEIVRDAFRESLRRKPRLGKDL